MIVNNRKNENTMQKHVIQLKIAWLYKTFVLCKILLLICFLFSPFREQRNSWQLFHYHIRLWGLCNVINIKLGFFNNLPVIIQLSKEKCSCWISIIYSTRQLNTTHFLGALLILHAHTSFTSKLSSFLIYSFYLAYWK